MGILPGMRDRGTGIIINVASFAGEHTASKEARVQSCWGKDSRRSLYSAPVQASWKDGASYPCSASLHAEDQGLLPLLPAPCTLASSVTALCPGSVNTELWDTETVKMNFDRSKMLTPEIVAQSILYTAKLPKQAVIDEMTLMPSAGTF